MGRGGEVVDCEEYVELDEKGERGEKEEVTMLEEGEGEGEGEVEKGVEKAVQEYFEGLRKNELGIGVSGHQAKKVVKANQALTREVKRKSREVVQVEKKGPGQGLSSARRRKYRRNA